MISTSPVANNEEMAHLIPLLFDETLLNELIIGDIHAPMNKVSDIFKLVDGNALKSGWSIFHGYKFPIIVFPPKFPEGWDSIRSFVNHLNYQEIMVSFPIRVNNESPKKPWSKWETYKWEHLFTDNAMKFTGELEIMDISDLPKIRGIGYSEKEKLISFFEEEEQNGDYSGIFHPYQMESDLYVVAENEDGTILATAGSHYETPFTVQLGNIYVKKEYRNRGIGRALSTAVTLGINRSGRTPTLFVNSANDVARSLYEKMGFEIFNQFEFYRGTLK
ncbi:MAG: GNAT family N-acetyltransferase [Candidatus Kariarchaeaceae archaeon]